MSNEEANSVYKCTVSEYHVSNKWDAGDTPVQTMELSTQGEVKDVDESSIVTIWTNSWV
jgi:hypothetical protein